MQGESAFIMEITYDKVKDEVKVNGHLWAAREKGEHHGDVYFRYRYKDMVSEWRTAEMNSQPSALFTEYKAIYGTLRELAGEGMSMQERVILRLV